MKNKKKFYISVIIILIIFLTHARGVQAVKQAIFPDSQSLQPISLPPGTHPNISGNINSTVKSGPVDQENSTNNKIPGDATDQQNSTASGHSALFYIVWSIIILLVIVFVFILYYKKRKDTT